MNNAIVSSLESVKMVVSLVQSRWGTPVPQIELRAPKGTHYRKLSAALHALAAAVEVATPTSERWVVGMEAFQNDRGHVYLELAKGDSAEAQRGMAMLRRIAE